VRDNKKANFRHFLNSSKLSIVAAKSVQVMSPYTSNASDSHTVLHTLWSVHDWVPISMIFYLPRSNNNSSKLGVCGIPGGTILFKRSPSINSSLSLFEPMDNSSSNNNNNNGCFLKKSQNHQLRHSYRHHANLVAPPPLNSPSSFSECDARLSTFSPEPLRLPSEAHHRNIPPSILENEAYQSDTNMSISSFQTFQVLLTLKFCEKFVKTFLKIFFFTILEIFGKLGNFLEILENFGKF
jgi:hypothetical protein